MRTMAVLSACVLGLAVGAESAESDVPENLYRGVLVSFPGPWAFMLGRSGIILVSDQELVDMANNPDKVMDLSLTFNKDERSLRQTCEAAKAAGHRTLILAFDHFFRQYRPGQDTPRRLMPDMDEYVALIAKISRFAQEYGLGLELSLLSPLEIGPGYAKQTGNHGIWMHYRKGLRDPKTGAFDVQLWQQRRWAANKGPADIEAAGVRVFAFKESPIQGTNYRAIDPKGIVEISDVAQIEVMEGLTRGGTDYQARRVRIHGTGRTDIGDLDRVLVVQVYRTPEMDYFAPDALDYLKKLVDKYVDAGVKLNALYADEMHIQQDWGYFSHHDHGEFALRYVTDNLAKRYAELYGREFGDFAKYLVYFVHGQEDFANDLTAKADVTHVFGSSPEDIQRTALFRARYYHLLQDSVVDLFTDAKHHAERRAGYKLESRAHATWAESPTIDKWEVGREPHQRHQYEYTSNFVWSNTVQQAASACYDYFKWGDFLTGNGNDHTEGGFLDRTYMALALACSTGILNDVPYSYGAHWGMPDELSRRRMSVVNAYGAAGSPLFGIVQDMQHRDTNVLMLYPMDLVAADERFGSWMTQYGYANTVAQAKLLERGKVVDGAIEMAGRQFTTLVATFEPFPSEKLLALMSELVRGGGLVVWSSTPPLLTAEGNDARGPWQDVFGVDWTPRVDGGRIAPGRQVTFEGKLASVAPQTILTDFTVDRIHPVTPREGTEVVARSSEYVLGTVRKTNGLAVYLGYRPRDDQSKSLGYETRNWFEVLDALGAYPGTTLDADVKDNPDYLSRMTGTVACRFPNGAIALAPHFRDIEEGWPGGFARNGEKDAEYLRNNPPPLETLQLTGLHVSGHVVDYDGEQAMAFRVDDSGELIAFAGSNADRITVDGKTTVFAGQKGPQLAWAPVPGERRVEGGAVLQFLSYGPGTYRIPAGSLPERVELVAEGPTPGSRGDAIPANIENGTLVFELAPPYVGRWLYVAPAN